MKRYKDYMDGVEVSDTLHEKLKHLDEPKKQAQPWVKWGAMAAAFALVMGAGAWGLSRGGWGTLMDHFDANAEVGIVDVDREDIPILPEPDIAFEDPDGNFTAPSNGGGYEVVDGEIAAYYVLPYLEWADASVQSQTAADYALAPPSAVSRGAAPDDVLALVGGEKAMADHLLWDGLDWGGLFWFLEDGTSCAAALYADGEALHLSLEVMQDGEVPSCIRLPDEYYETSQWQGVEITALKNGGYMVTDDGAELREKREVSFFCDGVGYKLTLYADDVYRADEMCARFVRYAIDDGFRLDVLSTDGVLDCSYYFVGEPNWEDGVSDEDSDADGFYCDCPDCIAGIDHTHPYDLNVTAEAKTPTPPN